jgi:hypothetical protein
VVLDGGEPTNGISFADLLEVGIEILLGLGTGTAILFDERIKKRINLIR